MFPDRYFALRFYPNRYFPPGGDAAPPDSPPDAPPDSFAQQVEGGSGGWIGPHKRSLPVGYRGGNPNYNPPSFERIYEDEEPPPVEPAPIPQKIILNTKEDFLKLGLEAGFSKETVEDLLARDRELLIVALLATA